MRHFVAFFLGGAFGLLISIAILEPLVLRFTLIVIGCTCLGVIIGSWPKRKPR